MVFSTFFNNNNNNKLYVVSFNATHVTAKLCPVYCLTTSPVLKLNSRLQWSLLAVTK